jgi:competence protein ComEA
MTDPANNRRGWWPFARRGTQPASPPAVWLSEHRPVLLAIVALALIAGAACLGAWWSGKSQSQQASPELALTLVSQSPLSDNPNEQLTTANLPVDGEATATNQPNNSRIAVHVAGAVAQPGLVELPNDARVNDAITAAGGPTDQADLNALNLARKLVDGEQVFVPKPGQTPPPLIDQPVSGRMDFSETTTSADSSTQTTDNGIKGDGLLNLNSATEVELQTLPGIGPVLAGRIVEYRQTHGTFTNIEELSNVSGIGPTIMSRLRTLVTVS